MANDLHDFISIKAAGVVEPFGQAFDRPPEIRNDRFCPLKTIAEHLIALGLRREHFKDSGNVLKVGAACIEISQGSHIGGGPRKAHGQSLPHPISVLRTA